MLLNNILIVAGAGGMGDVMDVLARGYRCVTFENDPVQFKATAVLIPQLEIVDESLLVNPSTRCFLAWR